MTAFDPHAALEQLFDEYSRRLGAIRRDLSQQRNADFAEQAVERQNDEVLQALLAEAETELRQVERARLRLAEGRYGQCVSCGEKIAPARLQALPAAESCVTCVARAEA